MFIMCCFVRSPRPQAKIPVPANTAPTGNTMKCEFYLIKLPPDNSTDSKDSRREVSPVQKKKSVSFWAGFKIPGYAHLFSPKLIRFFTESCRML